MSRIEAKRSEVRQRTEMVALRLLPEERTALEAHAWNECVSLSELLRSSALSAIGYVPANKEG